MFTKHFLFTHLAIALFASIDCGKCPPQEIMNPCSCDYIYIRCGGNQTIDLKRIFQNMALKLEQKEDKQFDAFVLNNTAITELEDNTFQDITFKTIYLFHVKNLKKISSNAFSPHNINTIETFEVSGRSQLGGHQYINEFFTSMSSLINIKKMFIFETQITTIPYNAFNQTNGFQNNLEDLNLKENKIQSIGDYAFNSLNNLKFLNFDFNEINHISVHTFEFRKESEYKLYIQFFQNKLNDTSIEVGAFVNAKRPLYIDFSANNFTTLDEKIFGPILNINKKNELLFSDNLFECDCRMYWIFKNRDLYRDRIGGQFFKCENGEDFWSLTELDFEKCKG